MSSDWRLSLLVAAAMGSVLVSCGSASPHESAAEAQRASTAPEPEAAEPESDAASADTEPAEPQAELPSKADLERREAGKERAAAMLGGGKPSEEGPLRLDVRIVDGNVDRATISDQLKTRESSLHDCFHGVSGKVVLKVEVAADGQPEFTVTDNTGPVTAAGCITDQLAGLDLSNAGDGARLWIRVRPR